MDLTMVLHEKYVLNVFLPSSFHNITFTIKLFYTIYLLFHSTAHSSVKLFHPFLSYLSKTTIINHCNIIFFFDNHLPFAVLSVNNYFEHHFIFQDFNYILGILKVGIAFDMIWQFYVKVLNLFSCLVFLGKVDFIFLYLRFSWLLSMEIKSCLLGFFPVYYWG